MRIDEHGGNPSAADLGAKPDRPAEVLNPRGSKQVRISFGEIKTETCLYGQRVSSKETTAAMGTWVNGKPFDE